MANRNSLAFVVLHIALVIFMTRQQRWDVFLAINWFLGIAIGLVGSGCLIFSRHADLGGFSIWLSATSFACTAWMLQNVPWDCANSAVPATRPIK